MDVILDANILIDLLKLECLSMVLNLGDHRFHVADTVVAEILRPEQAAALQACLHEGAIAVAVIDGDEETNRYAPLAIRLGAGDATSMAIAAARGWTLASNEKGRQFRSEARAHLGGARILRTADLLAEVIRGRALEPTALRRWLDHLREQARLPREQKAVEYFEGVIAEALQLAGGGT
jgi:hypothetical protein